MAKEYIIDDNVCPACEYHYDKSDYTGNTVVCVRCGYEKMLRTPLQKKRESTVLKNQIELVTSNPLKSMAYCVLIMPAALVLYILLGPDSFADIWAEHRVGCIVYLAITLWAVLAWLGLTFINGRTNRKLIEHGYDMDWVRSQFRKKGGGNKKMSFKLWGINVDHIDKEIKRYE